MTTKVSDVIATATIKFVKGGEIQVSLSTCDGITARMCDALPGVVWKELNALRTKKRLADTVKQQAARVAAEEAARRELEKQNADRRN